MVDEKIEFWLFTSRELVNIKKELEKLKKIVDLKELKEEAIECFTIRKRNFEELEEWYNNNELYEIGNTFDNQLLERRYEKLKNLLNELEEIKNKALKDLQTAQSNTLQSTSCYQCKALFQPQTIYYTHPTKNDNHKFCSENCYNFFYAPTCELCQQKCLSQTYPRNLLNNTGIICATCYNKRKKELGKILKEKQSNNQQQQQRERERERERERAIYHLALNVNKNELPIFFECNQKPMIT